MTSKGEELISVILKNNNILFEREKTFNDLKHGLLRFDFYLPERNIIIEWDGLQHFEQVSYFQKTKVKKGRKVLDEIAVSARKPQTKRVKRRPPGHWTEHLKETFV